jgi:hypothetical protein
MMEDDSIGFAKPPQSSRFKKGKSGNPNGRPRGTMSPGLALRKALREAVVVQENGKRKKITKLQAIMKQAVNNAARGDARAAQQLINLFRVFGNEVAEDSRLAPTVLQLVGVESDGNGRPKVIRGIIETDEYGNVSGDMELYRKNPPD